MEMKTGIWTNVFASARPSYDCLDASSVHYQKVLATGFENYSQPNCILSHYQSFIPNCTVFNKNGYNSTEKKGFLCYFCHMLRILTYFSLREA